MFYLYPSYIAWNYYWYITVGALATIQAAASVARLQGLQIGGRLWQPVTAHRMLAAVVIVATIAFVFFSPDLLSPGLAGSELMLVFGAGVLTAAATSLLGGLYCRQPASGAVMPTEAVEFVLPVAGYTYRLWGTPRDDGRMVIVLSDPDLPTEAALSLCLTAFENGFPCFLVEWGREGVPDYPDALAVVPMCISAHGGEHPRALVVGSGPAGDLALRAAADDDRVEGVLAVAPVLSPFNLVGGLALLRSMNVLDAWRWYRAWDRRSFIKALRAHEVLPRVGGRGHLLSGPDDGLFLSSGCDDDIQTAGMQCRTRSGLSHRALVLGEASQWLAEILATTREADDDGA